MNNPNPNPLNPQGSLLQTKDQGRNRLKLAVFVVVGIHVVGLTALLVLQQGCGNKKDDTSTLTPGTGTDAGTTTFVDSNAIPVTPTFEPTNTLNPPPLATTPSNPPPIGGGTGLPPIPATSPSITPLTEPVPGEMRTHDVESGDSFYSLSKKYHVSMKAIEAANPGVDSRKLKLKQKLNIPPVSTTTSNAAPPTAAGPAADSDSTYTVKSGDTLDKIARNHGTTWKALMKLNDLTNTKIKVGDKLKVPAKAAPPASTTPGLETTAPPAGGTGTTPPPPPPIGQ